MALSFNIDAISIILNHHSDVFSTDEKVVGLRYCLENKHYLFKTKGQKTFDILESDEKLSRLLKTTSLFSWHKESEFPFFISKPQLSNNKQDDKSGIFEELEKTVLLIKIAPKFLNQTLFFIVYYDKYLSEYGLSKSDDIITTKLKNVIANQVYRTLNSILLTAYNDHKIFKESISPINKSIIEENKRLKNLTLSKQQNKPFENIIKSLFKKHLPIDIQLDNIEITEAALTKLAPFSHQFEEIELMVQRAINYLSILQDETWDKHLEIEDFLIQTPLIKEEKNISISAAKMKKTTEYLDDLETAISRVLEQHQKPTLENIGNYTLRKISAAAISDYLKKNSHSLKEAFVQYPLEWRKLKKFCKPVKNILEETKGNNTSKMKISI